MRKFMNNRGFTLVELLMTITILSLVMVSLYGLLESGMTSFKKSDSHLEQIQHLRIAMEFLGRDIRNANSVSFDDNILEITIPDGTIIKYGLDTENIFGPSGLAGKKLWRHTVSNPLASYLDDFQVSISDNIVEVTLKAITPEGKDVILTNTFYLRNKL